MSYSVRESLDELQTDIRKAVDTRDIEALYELADTLKEAGEEEHAEALRDLAKRYDREDWAYDEARDNNL